MAAEPAPSPSGGRDRAIDALRGGCIFMMLANHLAPLSLANRLTHAPLYVDGAQGFVFLSGFVLGMVHLRRTVKIGSRAARGKLLARAAQLYLTHLVLVFGALFGAVVLGTSQEPLGRPAGQGLPAAIANVLLLRWQPPYLDILPLYIILIALGPLPLALLERGLAPVVAAASLLLYVAAQLFPGFLEFRQQTVSGGYGLAPAAWQILFYGGLILGYTRARANAAPGLLAPHSPIRIVAFAAASICFVIAQTQRPALASLNFIPAETAAWLLDKSLLGPGRLVYFSSAIVTAETAIRFLLARQRIPQTLAWLEALGRNSLYSYVIHLVMLGGFFLFDLRRLPIVLADLALALFLVTLTLMIRRDKLRGIIPN